VRLVCRLRAARGEKSLRDMANETRISRGQLSEIETGRRLPTDNQVTVLELSYGVARDDFYATAAPVATLLPVVSDEDERAA
jgi:transcriptional regulator with XRE-family HTH domain